MALQKVPGRMIQLDSQANSDIMYFDGTDWVRLEKGEAGQVLSVNEDATTPQWGPACLFGGTQRGYACAGLALSPNVFHDDIMYWSFASDGNSTEGGYGDLQRGARFLNGHSSQTHGYASGGLGAGSPQVLFNVIDRFSFTTEGASTDWADLTNGMGRCAAVSSCTHGFTMGGSDDQGGIFFVIDKFPFATQTNATDWADITESKYGGAGCSSTSHGYMMGGVNASSVLLNVIEKVPYETQTNATDVGDITLARHSPAGVSSITHGYCSGGTVQTASIVNSDIVERVSFASGTQNATDHGDLSLARRHPAGSSSDTHGYTAGGNFGSTASTPIDQMTDRIDKFAYASNVTATDVGNLYFQGSNREHDGMSGHQY